MCVYVHILNVSSIREGCMYQYRGQKKGLKLRYFFPLQTKRCRLPSRKQKRMITNHNLIWSQIENNFFSNLMEYLVNFFLRKERKDESK